ncbi:hypothetical protein BC937DRAFT_87658 [Endogone sp. FLAS-F59071]|nr:hypothetical protein BC937DRAFT_87658 [Endogone sp. FLAS-F59071]|eukprot:RUS19334.1 hypothetical protein BC937DRAFT_87658 [Endogone sp. FLAS-F59071]
MGHRVRRVGQYIISFRLPSLLDLSDLFPDRDHGVAESVKLSLGLGLGGLNHERVSDGPRHGRTPLGHIDSFDVCGGAEGASVDDELVRALPVIVRVENLGELRSLLQAATTHHFDVGPRNREDRGRAPGCGGYGLDGLVTSRLDDRVAGEEGREMGFAENSK